MVVAPSYLLCIYHLNYFLLDNSVLLIDVYSLFEISIKMIGKVWKDGY